MALNLASAISTFLVLPLTQLYSAINASAGNKANKATPNIIPTDNTVDVNAHATMGTLTAAEYNAAPVTNNPKEYEFTNIDLSFF